MVRFPESLGARRDFAYPWMVPLDDERWFLVFYCGRNSGSNSIYGMTLRPARRP